MGIFEYLFERKNPGKVGGIEKNNQKIEKVNLAILICNLIISLFIISLLFYYFVIKYFSMGRLIAFIIIGFLYCFISYKYIPRPDFSNMGLLGGLIDHPFKYTDDMNRFLCVLSVLLLPGRFIATTLLQTITFLKNMKRK